MIQNDFGFKSEPDSFWEKTEIVMGRPKRVAAKKIKSFKEEDASFSEKEEEEVCVSSCLFFFLPFPSFFGRAHPGPGGL